MTPDVSTEWEDDDTLPEGRVMGNFIMLPTGKIFLVNGVNQGVAGYGNDVSMPFTLYQEVYLQCHCRPGLLDIRMPRSPYMRP